MPDRPRTKLRTAPWSPPWNTRIRRLPVNAVAAANAITFASVPEFVKRTSAIRRKSLAHQAGELGLGDGMSCEIDAAVERRDHGRADDRIGVAEAAGRELAEHVYVLVAVEIPEPAALAAGDGEREGDRDTERFSCSRPASPPSPRRVGQGSSGSRRETSRSLPPRRPRDRRNATPERRDSYRWA